MPIVRIQMAKGRSTEEKKRLMTAVTDAIHQSVGAPLSSIHIMIQEIPAEDIMIEGRLLTEIDKGSRV